MLPIATGETPRGLSAVGQIQAILFDVYGTLLISRAGEGNVLDNHSEWESIQKLLQQFDMPETPDQVIQHLQKSIAKEHTHLQSQGIDFPEIDILEIWGDILGWFDRARLKLFAQAYESIVNPVYPMPGLRDLLRACRERSLTLGIISNAQFYTHGLLENILTQPLNFWGFDPQLIYYSYQYQMAKPSVYLFEMAAQRLRECRIQLKDSLYVGNDMRNDILPAKTVGFQTALFAGDQRSLRWRKHDPRCRNLVPDMIVTDLRQLIPSAVSDQV